MINKQRLSILRKSKTSNVTSLIVCPFEDFSQPLFVSEASSISGWLWVIKSEDKVQGPQLGPLVGHPVTA